MSRPAWARAEFTAEVPAEMPAEMPAEVPAEMIDSPARPLILMGKQ